MLLSFVISERDPRTGMPTGLLTAAYRLLRGQNLMASDEEELQHQVLWLERHLPKPQRFARKRNVSHKHTHGVSWLKSEAEEALRRFHAITEVLRRNDLPVEILYTERPGYVVYEDAWQVVAEPFHGDSH